MFVHTPDGQKGGYHYLLYHTEALANYGALTWLLWISIGRETASMEG